MEFLRRLFTKDTLKTEPASGETSKVEPSVAGAQKIQGVLVLSRHSMDQPAVLGLTQQILDEQKSQGYGIAEGFIAKHVAAGTYIDDDMYTHGKLLSEFSMFGGKELLNRTKVFPYHIPGGSSGKFYVIYDHR